MAENRDGAKLAARYRALATEEPSAVLDDAIRAAARRAVSSAPGRRASNWTIPASIAAVLVLSFGVTLRMLEEQPGIESSAPVAPAPEAVKSLDTVQKPERPKPVEAPVDVPAEAKEKKRFVPTPAARAPAPVAEPTPKVVPAPTEAPAAARPPARAPEAFRDARPAPAAPPAAPPAAAPALAPAPAPVPAAAASAPAAPAPQANLAAGRRDEAVGGLTAKRAKSEEAESRVMERAAQAPAGAIAETPERQLEKIAELRRAGRDREADEALAKFRKEHPDFVIKPEVWERVKPR